MLKKNKLIICDYQPFATSNCIFLLANMKTLKSHISSTFSYEKALINKLSHIEF